MATGTSAIRSPTNDLGNHTIVIRQLKEIAEVGQRLRGDPTDSFVKVSELVNAGIARFTNNQIQPAGSTAGSGGTVLTALSVQGTGVSVSPIELVGDSASPGNSMLYGTDGSGVKGWYAQPSGSSSPLTTKGDVYVFGSTNTRLPVGTNGQVLTSDSTQTTGLKWAAASGGSGTTVVLGNFTPDSHPGSPDANNDEFEGSALSAQWTITNPSTTTFATKQGYLRIVSNNASVNTYVFEPLTNTTAFKYRAKCMMDLGAGSFAFTGLCLYNSGNGHNIIWGQEQNVSGRQAFYATALSGSYSSLGTETTLGGINAFVYLEIEMDATNVYLRSSQTGEEGTFNTVATQALSGNMGGATHIGFMVNGVTSSFICDWIRRVDTGTVPSTGNAVANPNITPDTHPATATAWDDEFEFGSALDTSGSRRASANAWTVHNAHTSSNVVKFGALAVLAGGSANANDDTVYTQPLTGVGSTWAFTIKRYSVNGASTSFSGMWVGLVATGKGYYFGNSNNTDFVINQTTYAGASAASSFSTAISAASPRYYRIAFDGTNLVFSASPDGVIYQTYFTVLPATFLGGAPDSIGLMAGFVGSVSGFDFTAAYDWFRKTA